MLMAVVYRHRRLDTNEVFYIGIGGKEKRAYSTENRNKYWHNIVNRYGYEVDIIVEDIDYDKARELEKSLIFLYGRKDLNKGTLVNATDGGEGVLGYKFTEESKLRMSEIKKGMKASPEAKKNMSIAQKGRKHTKETLDKISASRVCKPVMQFNLDGTYIKTFNSITIASEESGVELSNLASVCRGKRNCAGGFIWRFSESVFSDKNNIESITSLKEVNKVRSIYKPVIQYSLTGDFIQEFKSISYAAEKMGISIESISGVCRGRRKSSKGFLWKFKNEINN